MKSLLPLLVLFLFSLFPNSIPSFTGYHSHSVKRAESTEVTTPQLVFDNTEKTYTQNCSYSLTLSSKSVNKISTLSFDILYEKDVIEVSYTSNYLSMDSTSMFDSKIDNNNGVIHVSYIFSENQKLEDRSIFYFSFSVRQTEKKNSYFSLAITQATDQDANQVEVKGDFDYFSIKESVQTSQDIYIYSSIDKTGAKRNETITISYYSYSFDSMGAGTLEFTYDRDAFEYFSFTKGDFLSDASRYSFVKTDIAGSVKVSFAAMDTESTYYYNIFSVSLKVKANIDKQWNFTLEASGLTSKDGNAKYTAPVVTSTINTVYEQDTSLLPLRYLTSAKDDTNKKLIITLSLEKDGHLSAADIEIDFDKTYLSYSSYKSLVNLSDNPRLGVNTNDAKNGVLKLSWVYLSDLTSKIDFASFEFDILDVVVSATTSLKLQGSGTRDSNLKKVDLAYQGVDVSLAINKHNWSEWETVTEPTCVKDGLEKRTCSYCNQIETKVLPKTGAHSYGAWVIDKEPTCTEAGSKHRTCSACGDIQHESVDPLGHDEGKWVVSAEPTCTKEGKKERRCTRCGEVLESSVIPATSHSYGDWVVDKEPSCTETGSKHKTCSACGDTITEVIPALGHVYHREREEPTCTKDGTVIDACSRCGDKKIVEVLPAKGHSYGDWIIDKAPTCAEDGLEKRTCSVCGYSENRTLQKTGVHTYGEWVVDKEPTTDSEGVRSRTCTACGHKETESIAKLEEKNKSGVVSGVVIGAVLGFGALSLIPVLGKKKKKK